LSLVLSNCAELPALRQASLPDPTPQTEPVTPAQREHQRILSTYGGSYNHPRLAALTSQVVEKLVAASERPDLRYKVTILNSPSINAFALPNGQLYVTRGLLALANDTSELASVLSHEMAHVIARHAAIREDQMRQAALISRVATDVFKDPQMSALMLARSKLALAGFSRAQEFEADGIGVGIAARAGFDPFGSVRFLTNMGRNATLRPNGGGDPRFLEFLSSHPATPDRVKNALANARQYAAPGTGERDKATYLAALDGITFGEDPSEGFVRGRRFLHPKLGFTFTAPEGFVLDNTAQAVLGVKEGSLQALRLDMVRIPAEQSLSDYLRSGWIEGIEESSVEELSINGLPAATAIASGDQWTFRLYVIRLGADGYRFIFATKARTAEIDRSFRESVSTFRRMTAAEIRAAKPLRIKVVTVAPGDTVERLANRMAVGDRPLERFLVLNGLEPGATLKAGEKVKIVVE
jgi:predicted Zn-dependent protease